MRIAYVSLSFFESSIPLAKHISKQADIHFFGLVSERFLAPPNFDLQHAKQKSEGIYTAEDCLPSEHYLNNYLSDGRLKLIIVVLPSSTIRAFYYLRLLAQKIRLIKPDILHIIGDHPFLLLLKLLLSDMQTVHSFHEIDLARSLMGNTSKMKSFTLNFSLDMMIRYAMAKKNQIIVHSENIYDEFKKRFDYPYLHYIPYGTFEIYPSILNIPELVEKGYFLFFGYNRFYKGADILVHAAEYLDKKGFKGLRVLFAGKDVKKLALLYSGKSVTYYDGYLRDDELASFVKYSLAVIAPHRVASQSGIVNTAFAFGKPVIVSDIPGLANHVMEGRNGYVFRSGDSLDLAAKLMVLKSKEDSFKQISDIRTNFLPEWSDIAERTLMLYTSRGNQ